MAATTTDRPWDGSASRFSPKEWAASCLLDRGVGGVNDKSRYALPVREPDGTLNVNAVHAAAGRIGQVDAAAAAKRAAAVALTKCYGLLGTKPPDHVRELTGNTAGTGTDSVSSVERMVTAGAVEIRSTGTRKTVGGYAARFGARSREMSFGYERVNNGFFSEQAKAGFPNTMARWNHEPTLLLGTTSAQTLRVSVDHIGLDFSVDLPECRSDLFELIGRGDVASASFCFIAAPDGGDSWSYENGAPVRTLLRCAQLIDVAPVGGSAQAAYPSASVAIRSLARHCDTSVEEIRALADRDELRKLFTDTRRTLTTEQAGARLAELACPQHVARDHAYREAVLRLHARRAAWA